MNFAVWGEFSMFDNPHSVLVYLRPARLVYVRVTGPYDRSVPLAWEKLAGSFEGAGFALPQGRRYGIAHDNPADVGRQNCRYDACFAITPDTDDRVLRDLSITTLRGGAYACRRFSGAYDARSAIGTVFSEFEPLPGLAFDPARPIVSVHMGDITRPRGGDACSEILVPVIAVDDFRSASAVA